MKMIFKCAILMFLTLSCLTKLQAFDCFEKATEIHRIDQLVKDGSNVVMLIDGSWLAAESLQAVPEGFLVLEEGCWMSLEDALRCDNYYVWQCRRCKAWNPQGCNSCIRCRVPRGG